ncbi:hypothetical protein DMENIID0001_118750 [Sergentomyia squamirostris]
MLPEKQEAKGKKRILHRVCSEDTILIPEDERDDDDVFWDASSQVNGKDGVLLTSFRDIVKECPGEEDTSGEVVYSDFSDSEDDEGTEDKYKDCILSSDEDESPPPLELPANVSLDDLRGVGIKRKFRISDDESEDVNELSDMDDIIQGIRPKVLKLE